MRRRTHRRLEGPPPTQPTPAVVYDWSRFGRHRLRAPDGAIVDLPVPTAGAVSVWVASLWPEPYAPGGGWGRELWALVRVGGRGWRLPMHLAAGDVLEFGADTAEQPVRWYGIMDSYEVDRWATVQGPYPDPAAAYEDAQQLLGLERFLPALETQSTLSSERCQRHHHDHPKRRHRHL